MIFFLNEMTSQVTICPIFLVLTYMAVLRKVIFRLPMVLQSFDKIKIQHSDKKQMASEKDIFREAPIRFLGYANEVGESFRAVINVRWVWLSYGVASAYVLADAGSKTLQIHRKTTFANERERNLRAAKEGVDVLTWQSFASVVIPGFTINRICAASKYFLKKSPFKKHAKWITVGVGLSSIPFIIKPIDKFVDFAMDKTFRPLFGIEREHCK